jgi:4-amino-4-deoxy-L-arabinose transferase-like glycosyltransferase
MRHDRKPAQQNDQAGTRSQPYWVSSFIWITLLALLLLAASPTLLYPLTRDQGAYAYIADLLMQGGVPYRDAWDLKPPGVYFVYWLAFSLFGRSEFAVRLFDVLYTLLSAAVVYVLARAVFLDRSIAGLSAWLYALCYYLLVHFYSAANPEAFMVPFLAACVYGMVCGVRSRSSHLLLLSGAAGGFAFWFKPTASVVVLAMLAWTGVVTWQEHRKIGEVSRSLVAIILGGLLGLLPIGLYLYGHGLEELLELWRAYGTGAYLGARGLALGDGPLAMLDVIVRYLRDWQLLVWLSLAGTFAVLARRQADSAGAGPPPPTIWSDSAAVRSGEAVVVFLLSSLAAVIVQGKLFEYHWIPILAPAAILSAVCLTWLVQEIRGRPDRSWRDMRSVFAVVVIVGLLLWTGYDHITRYRRLVAYLAGHMTAEQYYAQFDIGTDFSHTGTLRAATYLRQHTEADETALIWGAEPLVNFLAQRRSPTKYVFSYMLVGQASSPQLEASRREFIDDLQKVTPTYIVLVERDVTPLTPMGSRAQLDEFPAFRAILETEYHFEIQVEDYLFYRSLGSETAFKPGMKKLSLMLHDLLSCFHPACV